MIVTDGVKKTSFEDIVKVVSRRAPFFLVTSRFDETNSEAIFEAMQADGYITLLQWRDIVDIKNQASFLHKTLMLEKAEARAISELNKGSNDDVHILQISDIQVGGYPEKDDNIEAQIINQIIRQHTANTTPDFRCMYRRSSTSRYAK